MHFKTLATPTEIQIRSAVSRFQTQKDIASFIQDKLVFHVGMTREPGGQLAMTVSCTKEMKELLEHQYPDFDGIRVVYTIGSPIEAYKN